MPSRSGAPSQSFFIRRAPGSLTRLFVALLVAALLSLGLGRPAVALAAADLTVKVYVDAGRDGVDSGSEPGLAGAAVAVYSADDKLVALANTNGGGLAVFPNLPDGEYRVEVTPLSGYVVSVPGADTNPGLVSRVSLAGGAANVQVGVRQLTGGTDAAAGSTRSITTRVWDDRDADGVQDADEPGRAGLTLELLNSTGVVVQTAVAGADGRYRFDAAPPGAGYSVRISAGLPAGYTLTASDRARDGIDSDAALGLFPPAVANVPSGAVGVNTDSVDIGLAQGAISGAVWRDVNSDGDYEPALEPRINGVTVQLVQGGTVIATTTTRPEQGEGGADGVFRFTDLPFGSYSVQVPNAEFQAGAVLFGAANSPTGPGSDDQATPNGQPGASDVVLGPIALDGSNVAAGSNRYGSALFGFYKGAAGDFVWFDLNRNGLQDGPEANLGVNGVVVFVDDGRGGGVANNGIRDGGEIATVTGNNPFSGLPGFYLFDDLPLGATYRITLDSSNFAPGGALEGFGSSNAIAGSAGDGTFFYRETTLDSATAADTGVDFGLTRADLGNFVFTDENGDGLFNPGEAPIPGVTVRLFREGGATPVFETVTDASGLYSIPNVTAVNYYATFDLSSAAAPANSFVASPQPEGITVNPAEIASPGVDYSDVITQVNPTTWSTPLFRPIAGIANNGVDAGFYQLTTVSGRAFFDTDGDNQDEAAPEPGMRAVAVRLLRSGDLSEAATATTDVTGAYSLANVAPGSYVVEFANPSSATYGFVTADVPAAGDPLASDVTDSATGRTAAVSVLSGTPVSEIDAGFAGTGQLSGRVFLDDDGSDTQTGPDGNLAGATATLTVTANLPNLVATYTSAATTTAASTNYSFAGLPGGAGVSFELAFAPPAATPAYQASVANQISESLDSDGPLVTVTDPAPGATLDFDQGYYQLVTITARVFEEDAGPVDNQFQAGNPGIADVTVRLEDRSTDTVVATQTSAADGLVTFSVKPGPYRLNIDQADAQLASFASSPNHTDPLPLPDLYSGDSSLTDNAGANSFGYYRAASVSGKVFFDRNLDNLKADEPGVQGVAVRLLDGATEVSTTTTFADGAYSFSNLYPGTYTVEFANPDTGNFAFIATGESDVTTPGPVATSSTLALTTAYGASQTNVDAGLIGLATVQGVTFTDNDGDGLRDESPAAPLDGVQITLTQAVNIPGRLSTTISRVQTTSGGAYSFGGLPGGAAGEADFSLSFAPPAATPAWQPTLADVGGDDGIDSDGNLTGQALAAGAAEDRDQGYYQPVTITARVFRDSTLPLNNQWDAGEPGIAGVAVVLEALPGGAAVETKTTDSNGLVSFTTAPGDYRLNIDEASAALSGLIAAPGNSGQATASGSPFQSGASSLTEAASPGTTNVFGYYQNVTITARVFDEQVTVDNTAQSGEPGLAGVTVNLTGTETASAATDAAGLVSFTVQPGTYSLAVAADPAGFTRSPGNAGSVSLGAVTASPAASLFGYYRTSIIAGSAWYDSDGDGVRDIGEPPMEGRTVELIGDVRGLVASSVLDASGAYGFSAVDPTGTAGGDSSYQLCFELPAGLGFTQQGALATDDNSDVNPADGCTEPFTLGSNQTLSTIDAGYRGALSVGDLVWEDLDADGVQDSGERGLAGATVTVAFTTADGVINSANPTVVVSATTAASGSLTANYLLENVPPASGWEVLSVTPPFGYAASPSDAGADDSADSDPLGSYAQALSASYSDLDFGFYQATAVGDRVWLDLNGNGTYEASADLGVPGVTVELLQGGSVVASATTAAGEQAGSYSFVDVSPGTYSLRFTAPAGYAFVNDGAGSATADNDNDARLDGTTAEFSLASGQARAGLDAGLRGTAGVAGLVWVDEDRDGVRGDADTGRIEGAQAVLTLTPDLLPDATVTFTATSAADGTYAFADLPAGAGVLRFASAPGYIAVRANVGGDDERDSDGPQVSLTLAGGVMLEHVDQGYLERGRILWLPMMFGEPQKPDLTVSFAVSPTSPTAGKDTAINVTVTNQGTGPASGFWVDFYINPAHAPAVNERWDELCTLEPCFGLAWFYEGTLQPGESVTLNSLPQSAANPNGYKVQSSTWPGFFANGTRRLYALVDSWNRGSDARDANGALREIDETNNRAEQAIVVGLGPLPPEYPQLRLNSLPTR